MTRLIVALLGLIAFLNLGTVTRAQDDFKRILEGNSNCRTGRVKISSGELAKQDFPSLDAAQVALDRVYASEGVTTLLRLLKNVCNEKEEGEKILLGPGRLDGGPTTTEYRNPESLVVFKRIGELVTFRVLESDGEFPGVRVVEAYLNNKNQKRCRPISSACWRCPDRKIICSVPRVVK